MSEHLERNDDAIDSLRCRMDADARFRRALSGYDPYEVRVYVENVKRIFAQQAKASKEEQESLIAQLDSARSEIQARNYAIKKLKDLLVQRESQLSSANARINTLLQAVKKHEAEREELERLRAAAASPDLTTERLQKLQDEAKQLRAALEQSSEALDVWKNEREQLIADNERLKQELYYQRNTPQRPAQEIEENRFYAAPPVQQRQPYQDPYAAQQPQQRQAYADPYAPQNAPVRPQYAEPYPVENRYAPVQPVPPVQQAQSVQPAQPAQKDFSQVADKLAAMFADAYLLISQFRNNTEEQPELPPQRPGQPYMQILRPDGGYSDNPFNRK